MQSFSCAVVPQRTDRSPFKSVTPPLPCCLLTVLDMTHYPALLSSCEGCYLDKFARIAKMQLQLACSATFRGDAVLEAIG